MKARTAVVAMLAVSVVSCNREPRSMVYFEKNLEEARELIADTDNCLGLDQTKMFTGTDECTNAHLAVKKVEARAEAERQRKANADAAKSGRMPTFRMKNSAEK